MVQNLKTNVPDPLLAHNRVIKSGILKPDQAHFSPWFLEGPRNLEEEGNDFTDFVGMSCAEAEDCGPSAFLMCAEDKSTGDDQKVCLHKNIFPIQGIEIGGTAVLTILMAMAVMSGIGGGGIIVPLLMMFYSLETKAAIAISGFTILTGSITRFITTFNEKHPSKDAVCIDYGITNVMLPTVLVGSIAGVFFNLALPAILIQITLTLLLLFLTVNSARKFKQIYDKENAEMEKERLVQIEMANTQL